MKNATSKPSWKKLKKKLRKKSEKDGEFQDGDYEEPYDMENDYAIEEED